MLQLTPYLNLDVQGKCLVDHVSGAHIALTFSEAEVLARLLAEPDVILTKEELLAVGWPERVVAPTSLTQCVSTLRKKLEPYPEVQLKTMARRGYQLHISEQSNVKMVALADPQSIKKAVLNVSLSIKASGILLVALIGAVIWYQCDLHGIIKHSANWRGGAPVPLVIGGQQTQAKLIYRNGMEQLHPSWWQKHIAPEGNQIAGNPSFSSFALADKNAYSMALCPGDSYEHCDGEGIINITTIDSRPAGVNMQEFIPLTQVLESRIRYNRITIPETAFSGGSITEHNYHGDVYFPVAGELLVRNDITMSLIYDEGETASGQFYFSSCVTDQDCLTTPIKSQIRGSFKQYNRSISGMKAEVFHIKVNQKSLTRPDEISSSAVHFFRQIRKHDVLDDELYFYRLYQNDNTAVWIVPRMGNFIMWTKYQTVSL
ncbi:helix-turn-helix domain-containing protein [Shewanella sp. NIFS-20-20]|uniref:winged helix-turn-helix domain-containing protein n=1 Tax=Shewanella sp. NIFS-20-20 TaxID=2853806 RepID=UPI001C447B38|nr:helix-turn-helix domain-containing protein [Shewanella sp. NIFS-20-20]MBV7317465.1 helix-turn-helix domain-containing protein [Shewanella sp. NIFS-20-20]